MPSEPHKILDSSKNASTLCVIGQIAQEIIREYAALPDDRKPPLTDFLYTLRVVTIQKAYKLLHENKTATAKLLNNNVVTTRKYINMGLIDVEHPE